MRSSTLLRADPMVDRTFYSVGLGAMGTRVAQILSARGWRAIGATSHQVGTGLAEIVPGASTEVDVRGDLAKATKADLCVIATGSTVAHVRDEVLWAIENGINVVSSAERLSYPWRSAPELSEAIHRAATAAGVSVLGTGINPGFVMDTLPVLVGLAADGVRGIRVRRVNDLSQFGPSVLASFGIGLSEAAFNDAVAEGKVVGHVGFEESVSLLAEAFGIEIVRLEERMRPIVGAQTRHAGDWVVPSGKVVGANQSIAAYAPHVEDPVIMLDHPQQIDPEAAGVETGDHLVLEADPAVSLRITPEITGGIGTAAVMANMADDLLTGQPGLLTMLDFLPVGARRRRWDHRIG